MQNPSQDVYDESEQYLDKIYSSLNWLPGGPWSTREKKPPQSLIDIGFREPIKERDAIHEFISTELMSQETASKFERQVITALSESQAEFRALRGKVNVKAITNLLNNEPSLARDELLSLVNGAYKYAFVRHPELDLFGTDSEPPHNRNTDLEEYYRLFKHIETRTCKNGGAEISFKNVTYEDDPTNDTQQAYRTFLLPMMNQEDLSNPKLLAHLIINRINCEPSAFTLADWEALHLGRASKLFLPKFADDRFIGLLTPSEVQRCQQTKRSSPYSYFMNDYILICSSAERDSEQNSLFTELREKGRLFGWADGIHLLLAQALLYRVLCGVTKAIALKSGQSKQEVNSRTIDPDRVAAWESTYHPIGIFDLVQEGIVEYGSYMPPALLSPEWPDEFKARFKRQLKWSKDHLMRLRNDPFYFQQCVDEQFEQHYGHISELPQPYAPYVPKKAAMAVPFHGRLPHFEVRDIDAKKGLMNDIIRRVVQWALYEVEMWQCLINKLDALWGLAVGKGVPLRCSRDSQRLNTMENQPELREAWIDLGFHARWFVERRIDHVAGHGGLIVGEGVRHLFRRDTTWPRLQVVKEDWDLPKEYTGTKIDFTIRATNLAPQGDAMDVDNDGMNMVELENLDSPTWWSVKNVQAGLASNFTIGTVGLPKLIQGLRTELYARNTATGAQTTVTRDCEAIYLIGLLCHQMQLVRPFGGDLVEARRRSERRRESPVGPFLLGFDDVPFENLVKEQTLRYTQWLLGIVYKPFGDENYGRHSMLAQLWVRNFWRELCDGLSRSTKELKPKESKESNRSKKKTSLAGGGIGGGVLKRHGSQGGRVSKTVALPRYCRPTGVQRYLATLKPPDEDIALKFDRYNCKKICGEIMTVAPPGHQEPPEWDPSLGELVVVPDPAKKPENETDKVGVLRKPIWGTIHRIWSHAVGPVVKRDVFDLFGAFKFAHQTAEGSRERFTWTPESLLPAPKSGGEDGEPEARSITIHLPHDNNMKMRDDQLRWLREACATVDITKESIEKAYHCQGTR
ncbi:hypothetical protein CSAL01_13213 [Colletotrichum salicis]|uniref:Uncharacterized protein n=1 Tax=Colletotrichum salicis TaxID=1209931 RepID=A0A135UJ62_9PEZI|nr:hypothetical protein CSAL01_13213 [Colletotrichum salicis]